MLHLATKHTFDLCTVKKKKKRKVSGMDRFKLFLFSHLISHPHCREVSENDAILWPTYFLPEPSTDCIKKKRAGRTMSVSRPGPQTRVWAALGTDPAGASGVAYVTSPRLQPSSNHDSNMVATRQPSDER